MTEPLTEQQLAEWERLAEPDYPYSSDRRQAITALVAEVRRLRRAEHNLRSGFQQKLSAAYLEAARAREGR